VSNGGSSDTVALGSPTVAVHIGSRSRRKNWFTEWVGEIFGEKLIKGEGI